MCWYQNEQDAKDKIKKCMEMYSAPLFTTYGYREQEPDSPIFIETYKKPHFPKFYNMELNLIFGRYCQSGVAVIEKDNYRMMCVQIDEIITNYERYQPKDCTGRTWCHNPNQTLDAYNIHQEYKKKGVFACYLLKDEPDACVYKFKDQKDGTLKTIN